MYCAATPGDCPASTLGILAVTSKSLFDPNVCEGTECPAGCCPGENWFCCPDNIYCASTAEYCPSAAADITGSSTTIGGVAFDPAAYFDTDLPPMRFISGTTAGEFVIPEWLGFNRAVYVNAQGGITDEYVAPRQIVRFRSTIVLGYDPAGSQAPGLPAPPEFTVSENIGNQEVGPVYKVSVTPVSGATGYVFRFNGAAIRPTYIGPQVASNALPEGLPAIGENEYLYNEDLDGYSMSAASTNGQGTGSFSEPTQIGKKPCDIDGDCGEGECCVDGKCETCEECVSDEECLSKSCPPSYFYVSGGDTCCPPGTTWGLWPPEDLGQGYICFNEGFTSPGVPPSDGHCCEGECVSAIECPSLLESSAYEYGNASVSLKCFSPNYPVKVFEQFKGRFLEVPTGYNYALYVSDDGSITAGDVQEGQILTYRSKIILGTKKESGSPCRYDSECNSENCEVCVENNFDLLGTLSSYGTCMSDCDYDQRCCPNDGGFCQDKDEDCCSKVSDCGDCEKCHEGNCISECTGNTKCCNGENCLEYCCDVTADCMANMCLKCEDGDCVSECLDGMMCCDGVCKPSCCSTSEDCTRGSPVECSTCVEGACLRGCFITILPMPGDSGPIGLIRTQCCDGTCCDIGEKCCAGTCCPEGQVCCSGMCVDPPCCEDDSWCESCSRCTIAPPPFSGSVCSSRCDSRGECCGGRCCTQCQRCVGGECVERCPGQFCCSGLCASKPCCGPNTFEIPCGPCEECLDGSCASQCSGDQVCCKGQCKDSCCESREDCGPCQNCVDGNCLNYCLNNQKCCGKKCCTACQKCVGGECIEKCPGQFCCEGICSDEPCCEEGQYCAPCESCIDGQCTPSCGEGNTCCGGQCAQSCCGDSSDCECGSCLDGICIGSCPSSSSSSSGECSTTADCEPCENCRSGSCVPCECERAYCGFTNEPENLPEGYQSESVQLGEWCVYKRTPFDPVVECTPETITVDGFAVTTDASTNCDGRCIG